MSLIGGSTFIVMLQFFHPQMMSFICFKFEEYENLIVW